MYKNQLSAKPSQLSIDGLSGIKLVEEEVSPMAKSNLKPTVSQFGPAPSSTKNGALKQVEQIEL